MKTTETIKITLFDNTEEFMDFSTHAEMVAWAKDCKSHFKSQGFVVHLIRRAGQPSTKINFQIRQPARYGGEVLSTATEAN